MEYTAYPSQSLIHSRETDTFFFIVQGRASRAHGFFPEGDQPHAVLPEAKVETVSS
jgi:hypothetical protein